MKTRAWLVGRDVGSPCCSFEDERMGEGPRGFLEMKKKSGRYLLDPGLRKDERVGERRDIYALTV